MADDCQCEQIVKHDKCEMRLIWKRSNVLACTVTMNCYRGKTNEHRNVPLFANNSLFFFFAME